MNINYTSICFYCGEIYSCNRSSSKYCCKNHNSLHFSNGSQINNYLRIYDGTFADCYGPLHKLYNFNRGDRPWSISYTPSEMFGWNFGYKGPLPYGDELLVVGSFIIKRALKEVGRVPSYFVKPIQLLSKKEKLTGVIIKAVSDFDSSIFQHMN